MVYILIQWYDIIIGMAYILIEWYDLIIGMAYILIEWYDLISQYDVFIIKFIFQPLLEVILNFQSLKVFQLWSLLLLLLIVRKYLFLSL